MTKDTQEIKHASFGQIRFSRCQGKGRFYGSDLNHNHYIQFEIKGSTLLRDLGWERYSSAGNPLLFRGRMTANQFSEMITSMNHEGIPCTIEFNNGEVEKLPEIESVHKFNHKKFSKRVDDRLDLTDGINKVEKLLQKQRLNKDEKKEISGILKSVKQELESNIPFFKKEIENQINKKVVEAKVEIENALNYKIESLGLKAYNEEQKQLNNENNSK